eukprot:tig00000025_g7918.t1
MAGSATAEVGPLGAAAAEEEEDASYAEVSSQQEVLDAKFACFIRGCLNQRVLGRVLCEEVPGEQGGAFLARFVDLSAAPVAAQGGRAELGKALEPLASWNAAYSLRLIFPPPGRSRSFSQAAGASPL